ncbi:MULTISPECIES: tetratricopeptide repeat protein [Streptomyces]|uniref:tetratricopeptide repeat protein n=1 Tax=Streptomyces TaxID=1883 RepID=UPI00163C943D|nr:MULTISPECIES: tetratricopeptide repeat protein [Streptomyces]MBC2878315.1 tetratricopeptide repeat protein [Streptomyces sp. TYQ1024]UKW33150.1 tetratricopeptide repeat protein [Streptomyces sp. TYQ1024]
MTSAGDGRQIPGEGHQEVRAVGGFAYGAVGADIHVFGDGSPLYLLLRHPEIVAQGSDWLRAQPSRMLDARLEVVEFTGREDEWAQLIAWRDSSDRLAVRWLHGAGGQGKTRLAARLAADGEESGWLVVHAVHGTDTHPPTEGSHDLRVRGHRGVLLLADYADRWPLGHWNWLFRNSLMRQSVPVRVLLSARSAHGWPALRGVLNRLRLGAETSDQFLAPLLGEHGFRDRLFRVARDCFARHYPDRAPGAAACSVDLAHPDFGLTLAVHMAALVAVDARAYGRTPPTDMLGLTGYLLDREQENWRQLYENRACGLDFRTPDQVLGRAVFTAILAGPLRRERAEELLEALMFERPGRVLSDHAVCYPSTRSESADVLEPLLPDRLAEDFLALTVPGSPVSGHPTDPWSVTAAHTVVERRRGQPVPWTGRAVSFLAAVTERWPHVGERVLYPLLLREPSLAIAGGSAALSSLARIEGADPEVLAAVYECVRRSQAAEAAVGGGDLGERMVADRLAAVGDEETRAALLLELAERRGAAGRWEEGKDAAEESVVLLRRLAHTMPEHEYALTVALHQLGVQLTTTHRYADARRVLEEALALCRPKAALEPQSATLLPHLLHVLAQTFWATDDIDQALALTQEARRLYDDLFHRDPSGWVCNLSLQSRLLSDQGALLARIGRLQEALELAEGAVVLARLFPLLQPDAVPQSLARALLTVGKLQYETGRLADAAQLVAEAVRLYRQLARVHPGGYRRELTSAVATLAGMLAEAGRHVEARIAAEEAIALREQGESQGDHYAAGWVTALYLVRHSEGPEERLPWGTEQEIGEAAERLVRSEEWPALWELTCSVPILDAIQLVHRFPGGCWQPPDATGRALMRRLASVDRRSVEAFTEICALAGTRQLPLAMDSTCHLAFAFGRPWMTCTAYGEDGLRMASVDLTTGRRQQVYQGGAYHEAVVCMGDDGVVAVRHAERNGSVPGELVRYVNGTAQVIASGAALYGAAGAATADGFLIGSRLVPTVLVGTSDGLYEADLFSIGLSRGDRLAVDPTGTRVAFAHGDRFVVTDTLMRSVYAQAVVRPHQGEITGLVMPAPDEVLTTDADGRMCRWQSVGDECHLIASAEQAPELIDLFTLTGWRIVGGWALREGMPFFLDSSTLVPVAPPRLVKDFLTELQDITVSPDRRYLVHSKGVYPSSSDGCHPQAVITVHDLEHPTAWPHRPLASLTERDRAALDVLEAPSPELRDLLNLMRAAAAYRSERANTTA